MKKILTCLILAAFVFVFASCTAPAEETTAGETSETTAQSTETENTTLAGKWSTAVYTDNAEIGEGATTVKIGVVTPEKSIVITVKTDETVLGKILLDNAVAEGEEGPFGLYIKKVNGISAVYETDGAYWALFADGELASTGADGIEIKNGAYYELVYTEA